MKYSTSIIHNIGIFSTFLEEAKKDIEIIEKIIEKVEPIIEQVIEQVIDAIPTLETKISTLQKIFNEVEIVNEIIEYEPYESSSGKVNLESIYPEVDEEDDIPKPLRKTTKKSTTK